MRNPFKRGASPEPGGDRGTPVLGLFVKKRDDDGEKSGGPAGGVPAFAAAIPAGSAGAPNHDDVRRADPYAFESAHRRLAWMFRISGMVNVGLIAVVIVEASAISTLVPLKKTDIALIRTVETDKVGRVDPADRVRVEPITRAVPGYDLLMESFVRRYTRLLLEIDEASQTPRMREAALYSDPDFWKRFGKERFPEIEAALKAGLNRSVVVETAERIYRRDGVNRYAVELTQTDERKGKADGSRKLRAYLVVTARPQTVRDSEKYENPLGLRVLDFSLKERGN